MWKQFPATSRQRNISSYTSRLFSKIKDIPVYRRKAPACYIVASWRLNSPLNVVRIYAVSPGCILRTDGALWTLKFQHRRIICLFWSLIIAPGGVQGGEVLWVQMVIRSIRFCKVVYDFRGMWVFFLLLVFSAYTVGRTSIWYTADFAGFPTYKARRGL